jgi:hypothetical protein
VPGGPDVRVGGGFGADRVGGVGVAGQFPVRADRGGPLLPGQPVHRMVRDRAQRADRPRKLIAGGVLADAVLAGVHRRGDLSGVAATFRVGDGGELRGPRAGRPRDEGAGAAAEPGVDDGGHVAGPGQVPLADRSSEDLIEVQPGELGCAHRPPQPFRLVTGFLPVSRRQGR